MVKPGMAIDALHATLGTGPRSCVAFIGAGGKTTLLLALARALRLAQACPIVTTTTKMRVPKEIPLVLEDAHQIGGVVNATGWACLGRSVSGEGKLVGIDRDTVCLLLSRDFGPILVEADGAAGKPLKFHAAHEPVVPPCATDVLVIAGVDAIGKSVQGVVHRALPACHILGWDPNAPIDTGHISALLTRALQFLPPRARPWLVLNKVDDAPSLRIAESVAGLLRGTGAPLLFASHGELVAPVQFSPAMKGSV
jgi:molybdenum cofactor cytidylyltransferase